MGLEVLLFSQFTLLITTLPCHSMARPACMEWNPGQPCSYMGGSVAGLLWPFLSAPQPGLSMFQPTHDCAEGPDGQEAALGNSQP